MLSLHEPTPATWVESVVGHLDELLVDHAHCEKKAAGVAMNLLFAYVDCVPLARAMGEIVTEELDHFRLVLDLLAERGIPFRRLSPAPYGARLQELVRKEEPGRAVDRLIVAGIIEARSCERFALLRDRAPDARLAAFWGGLFESEARHHSTYIRLAGEFAPQDAVAARLAELAAAEAAILAQPRSHPRMHS